jgi:hypothetical protein
MLKKYAGSRVSRYYELLTRKPILVVEDIWEAKCIGQIGMPNNLIVKRHGRYYEQKKVEVFYAVEEDLIITVTAYVFYGNWEA